MTCAVRSVKTYRHADGLCTRSFALLSSAICHGVGQSTGTADVLPSVGKVPSRFSDRQFAPPEANPLQARSACCEHLRSVPPVNDIARGCHAGWTDSTDQDATRSKRCCSRLCLLSISRYGQHRLAIAFYQMHSLHGLEVLGP